MTRTSATISAALLAAALLAMSATAASAATWNHENTSLNFPADPGFKQHCTKGRTVDLNGRYKWTSFGGRSDQGAPEPLKMRSRRERHVFRGRYQMIDCLYPDTNAAGAFVYRHESRVVNVRTGGQWMMGTDGKEDPKGRDFLDAGAGAYHWGSTIENVNKFKKKKS
jgi:hypothetical protein